MFCQLILLKRLKIEMEKKLGTIYYKVQVETFMNLVVTSSTPKIHWEPDSTREFKWWPYAWDTERDFEIH